jgi:tetratricopeptide (TPR) repeat protein
MTPHRLVHLASRIGFAGAILLACAGCAPAPTRSTPEPREASPEQTMPQPALARSDHELLALQSRVQERPFDGAARNSLGVAYLQQGRLGEAAAEFDEARRLLPGRPDPRLNLGLVFERSGRLHDSLAMYQSALDVDQDCMPAKQAVAHMRTLLAKNGADLTALLNEIALRGQTPTWRAWAQAQLRAEP